MPLTLDWKKRRREVILGGALVVVAVAFLYTRPGTSSAGSGETVLVVGPPPAVAGAISKLASVKIPGVLLDRLSDARAPYDPSQRNIFRYGNLPPPPPDPAEVARVEAAKRAAEEARQQAIQAALVAQQQQMQKEMEQKNQPPIDPGPPPPPPKPVPPAITLRYSGYLGSEQAKMAVLISGEDMLLARTGDVVEKQFKVLDIGFDWVKIGYVDPQFADQYQKLRMGP